MFRAIGFVIVLIAIRVIMPDVFAAFQHAAVQFFDLFSIVFSYPPNSVTQMAGVGFIDYVPPAASLR